MPSKLKYAVLALVTTAACAFPACAGGSTGASGEVAAPNSVHSATDHEADKASTDDEGEAAAPRAAAGEEAPDGPVDYRDPMPLEAQRANGIYLSGPMVDVKGIEGTIRTVKAARFNAAVIDMKDGAGRVTYDTQIPVLQQQKHNYLGNARELLSRLKAEGIYTIARIVCFADPVLPGLRPDLAIQDNRPRREGQPWRSWGTAGTWLDPYNRANHDMIVALAEEAEALGFEEIQLDYIRFPVDDGIPYAMFPEENDTPRWQLLLGLLRRIDAAVNIPLGVDVFGLTAFRFGNSEVLGQNLERWTDHVEVYSPMLYINSMRNWGRNLENRSYTLINTGVSQLRERLGPKPVIRPFLQSFAQGTDDYSPQFIADQIRGARQGGADGVLFWHPGSNYGMLFRGMRGPAARLTPFPIDRRAALRAADWGQTP